MKELIEKQILEWEKELVKQKQTKENAEAVLAEATKNIMMIEGGIQFGQTQIKNFEHQSINTGEETKQKK